MTFVADRFAVTTRGRTQTITGARRRQRFAMQWTANENRTDEILHGGSRSPTPLGVSTRTVRRWIKRGDLVAHHFGTAVRIAEADLKAFIARHRHP